MSKTIQIRDVPDEDYAALVRRAAEAGVTLPELLRREVARLAARPTVEEWLARTRRLTSATTTAEVVETLEELRGPWPDVVVDASCLYEVLAGTDRARRCAPGWAPQPGAGDFAHREGPPLSGRPGSTARRP